MQHSKRKQSHDKSRNLAIPKSYDILESRLQGVYERQLKKGRKLYTLNLNPGKAVYDEALVKEKGREYREWNPRKSKLGAAILKGLSQIGIKPGKSVLYLGCSTGTTCSHVSDILAKNGFLFGVDFSPRVMREFIFLSQRRPNMAPILADCNHPDQYKFIPAVDVLFQDIAQRNQVEIFLKNSDWYLKKGGFGLLAIKARSIDVTKRPKEIFKKVRNQLDRVFKIVDYRELDPYEKDHCLFVVKK